MNSTAYDAYPPAEQNSVKHDTHYNNNNKEQVAYVYQINMIKVLTYHTAQISLQYKS